MTEHAAFEEGKPTGGDVLEAPQAAGGKEPAAAPADLAFRHATEADIPRMLEIFAFAREFMVRAGNPNQWAAANWPPEWLIRQDVASGKSYVCEHEGRIVATFFLDYGASIEPTYERIDDGAWVGGEEYGVIHRIASDGTVKGAGRRCIEWALEQVGHIRIDTHEDNAPLRHILGSLGFVQCGTIYVREDNEPRIAFEKVR